MDRVLIKTNPRLFDKVVGELQKQLGAKVGWLDHVFGLVETVTDVVNGRKRKSASVYVGDGQYQQVAPCAELGNFCMFVLKDPQTYVGGSRKAIEAPFYGIFWYNVDNVSSSVDERNREAVKEYILSALQSIRYPYIEWKKVVENPASVFSDFDYEITDNQYMMSPYSGIRVEGVIRASVDCFASLCRGDFNNDYDEDFKRHCGMYREVHGDYNDDYNEDHNI